MTRRLMLSIAAVVLAHAASGTVQAGPTPVFDVDVALQGVTYDGIGWVWEYEVSALGGTNRGLSHWSMSVCGDPGVPLWDLTPPDVDYFDLSYFDQQIDHYYFTSDHGVRYEVEFGTDPRTGIRGIKFDYDGLGPGDQIGDRLPSDTFSFRLLADFEVVQRRWGAKGALLLDHGMAGGPACVPEGPPPPPHPRVPEPATILLLGLTGAGLALRRRRSANAPR